MGQTVASKREAEILNPSTPECDLLWEKDIINTVTNGFQHDVGIMIFPLPAGLKYAYKWLFFSFSLDSSNFMR